MTREPASTSCTWPGGTWLLAWLLLALASAANAQAAPALRGPAPDFALRALDGANYRLSEYRGDVVVLVFWGTWCGECRAGLAQVERLWRTYRTAGFMALGVNLDERAEAASSLARTMGTTFPTVHDTTKSVSRAFAIDVLPTVVLLDRAGQIRVVSTGRAGDAGTLDDSLRRLLDE